MTRPDGSERSHQGISAPRGRQERGSRVIGERGYVLPMVLLVLMALGLLSGTLLGMVRTNQQHVLRDRAYTQSLAVAEAGLNQFLWMIASGQCHESYNFALPGNTGPDPHTQTFALTDPYPSDELKYLYHQVTPPPPPFSDRSHGPTGATESPANSPYRLAPSCGRPAFSEPGSFTTTTLCGRPVGRVWYGKTHSNVGIRIETAEINDLVSCARQSYQYAQGQTKPGIWSNNVPENDPSRALWKFPVPPIDFNTVTSDFVRLNALATGVHNLLREPTQQGRNTVVYPHSPRQYQVPSTGESRARIQQRQQPRRLSDPRYAQRSSPLSQQRGHLRE